MNKYFGYPHISTIHFNIEKNTVQIIKQISKIVK